LQKIEPHDKLLRLKLLMAERPVTGRDPRSVIDGLNERRGAPALPGYDNATLSTVVVLQKLIRERGIAQAATDGRRFSLDALGTSPSTARHYKAFEQSGLMDDVYRKAREYLPKFVGDEFDYKRMLRKRVYRKIAAAETENRKRKQGIETVLPFPAVIELLEAVAQPTEGERVWKPDALGVNKQGAIVAGVSYLFLPSAELIQRHLRDFRIFIEKLKGTPIENPKLLVVVPKTAAKFTPPIPGVSYLRLPIDEGQVSKLSSGIFNSFRPQDYSDSRTLAEAWTNRAVAA
jgi:hypothetical protein